MCSYKLQKLKSTLRLVGRLTGFTKVESKALQIGFFFGKHTLALLLGYNDTDMGGISSAKRVISKYFLSFHEKMLNFFVWPGIQVKDQYKLEVAVCLILCFFVEAKPQNKIQSSTQMQK